MFESKIVETFKWKSMLLSETKETLSTLNALLINENNGTYESQCFLTKMRMKRFLIMINTNSELENDSFESLDYRVIKKITK